MNFFRQLAQQLQELWINASVSGRVVFVSVAVLSVAMMVGVGIWSSQPEYVPLATNLSPSEAAEMKSKLDAEGISNKLNYSGSALLVAQNQYSDARLIVGDIGPMFDEPEEASGMMWDPYEAPVQRRKRLEQSLARSISQMKSIDFARVHISMAEPTPFVREKSPTKASVVVMPNRNGGEDPVGAIVGIVVGGVHGLDPENITISDTNGRVIFSGMQSMNDKLDRQLAFRRTVETELAARAERMLSQALGEGKVLIRVTADVDFTNLQRIDTSFDPLAKAKKKESIQTSNVVNPPSAVQGAGGTSENLNPSLGPPPAVAPGGSNKTENIETEYALASTVDTMEKFGGDIKRLTIAAMVDLGEGVEGGAAVTTEEVEQIIKNAVGYDAARDDQIQVVATSLKTPLVEEAEPAAWNDGWRTWVDLAKSASLGIAAVIALTVFFLIFRRLQPVGGDRSDDVDITAARARAVAEIAAHAKRNPEAVSAILAAWLNSETPDEADNDQNATNRAA